MIEFTPIEWKNALPTETPVKVSIIDDVIGNIASSAVIEVKTPISPGTEFNAEAMNRIEQAIKSVCDQLNIAITDLGLSRSVPQGRLTLQPNSPIPSDDLTSSIVYYTPYNGNTIYLYDGEKWKVHSFGELVLSLSGLAANINYDIYCFETNGLLGLEAINWASNTTRSVELSRLGGILVKSTDFTRRFLGTIRTSETGACEDSVKKRFVWNMYNRLRRNLYVTETSLNWTYNVRALRPFNNNLTNRVEWVQGLVEDSLYLSFIATAKTATVTFFGIGLGIDSTIADDPLVTKTCGSSTTGDAMSANYCGRPNQPGYHFAQLLEIAGNGISVTFYGNNGINTDKAGLSGFMLA